MEKNEFQPYAFFIASVIFCCGFLLILINGYYHYTYLEFLEIGRKDLIARLGFLAYATGFLYYPTVIIPITVLTWFSMRKQDLKGKVIWIYSMSAILVVGLLFYTNAIDSLIYGTKENWFLGLILIGLTIPIYWNKNILKRIKRQHTTKPKLH